MSEHIVNALTVDVEDYYHVSAFSKVINRDAWSDQISHVVANTDRLLELFDTNKIKATFFVLGWVAERWPELVKKLDSHGHEVACHGYSHELVYNQTPEIFREETKRSKQILENIIQKPVLGYRAASYSITNKSKWALDILFELGFKYDSSIFPVKHDRYGMPDTPKFPYLLETPDGNKLIEFPLTSINIMGYQLPIAGGGYFRLFPYFFSKWAFQKINSRYSKPFIFYLHPWEIDTTQPRIKAGFISTFRHYNNIDKTQDRLSKLVRQFRFSTAYDVLKSMQLS